MLKNTGCQQVLRAKHLLTSAPNTLITPPPTTSIIITTTTTTTSLQLLLLSNEYYYYRSLYMNISYRYTAT